MNYMSLILAGGLCALVSQISLAADADKPAAAVKAFEPTAESLKNFKCPEWFRDAKFGIWAHWGPQAVPRQGDWYARKMYIEGGKQYLFHVEHYGHPSKFGFKDIIPLWKAEKWDPERLMTLYKKAGAQYFVSMGVHHDSFDLWNSRYNKWNAVNMGPKRDVVGEWKKAAVKNGLKFGVSEHLGASFGWYGVSHGADKKGPLAGVPYDGADPNYVSLYHDYDGAPFGGKDKWYTANAGWHKEWSQRVHDLVEQYQPDLLYTDGGIPFGEVGRTMVADFYNANMKQNGGKLEAVYNCKEMGSGEFIPGSCVQDVERGAMKDINPLPWQTDTSIGDWFFSDGYKYKTAAQVIRLMADIVSKNGNLLLNVVLYADGSLPPESEKYLEEMAAWMAVNSDAIYGTRPWKVYGEGPTVVAGGHFKEDFPFTADDVRFTAKGGALYMIALGVPTKELKIKSLGTGAKLADKAIADIKLLGSDEKIKWTQEEGGLVIQCPAKMPCDHAISFKITFKD